MSSMSDSLMAWKPRMLDPSKPRPSSKQPASNSVMGRLKCCQVPGRSQNLTSTILTPAWRAYSSTSSGLLSVGFTSPLECANFSTISLTITRFLLTLDR